MCYTICSKASNLVILALARGLKQNWEPDIKQAINDNRLLVVTPFDPKTIRPTIETASVRNKMMFELADEVVIGYSKPGGNIASLLPLFPDKKIIRL